MLTTLRIIKKTLLTTISFLIHGAPNTSFIQRTILVFNFFYISFHIDCPHFNFEILEIAKAILNLPPSIDGVIVEAGTYKGGSAAKLSLIAQLTERKLIIFDSFQGLPANTDIYGTRDRLFYRYNKSNHEPKKKHVFLKGQYRGTLKEVKHNIELYGAPQVCVYKKGWFERTMAIFNEPVAAIFLDVDLSSSTKTCLRYLYPLLQKGGVFFSHDGHLRRVLEIYKNSVFWENIVSVKKPIVDGIGKRRLLKIIKK